MECLTLNVRLDFPKTLLDILMRSAMFNPQLLHPNKGRIADNIALPLDDLVKALIRGLELRVLPRHKIP